MTGKLEKRDQLYFVLSCLVILLHSASYAFYDIAGIELSDITKTISDYIQFGITRLAIPCFLFFSGLLFYRGLNSKEILIKKIKSRIYTIFIPFYVWNILSVVWNWMVSNISFLSKNTAVRDSFILNKESIIKGVFYYKYHLSNWYLAQLIIFTLLSPIVYLLLKNKKASIIVYLGIVTAYLFDIHLAVNVQEHASIYYFLGALIGYYRYDEFVRFSNSFKGKKWTGALSLFGSLFILCLVYYLGIDFMRAGLFYIAASLLFWIFINSLTFESSFKRIYKYSYLTYLSHFIVLSCVNKLCWLFLPRNDIWYIIGQFITVFGTVFIISFGGFILRNYLPILYKLLTGEDNARLTKQDK